MYPAPASALQGACICPVGQMYISIYIYILVIYNTDINNIYMFLDCKSSRDYRLRLCRAHKYCLVFLCKPTKLKKRY